MNYVKALNRLAKIHPDCTIQNVIRYSHDVQVLCFTYNSFSCRATACLKAFTIMAYNDDEYFWMSFPSNNRYTSNFHWFLGELS